MDQTLEQWRPVVGYEGLYEVSSHGRVRSVDRAVSHYKGGVQNRKGRNKTLSRLKDGYLGTALCKDGVEKQRKVHILVAEAFLGPRPEWSTMVNHKDKVVANNYVDNLEWSDNGHNKRHANAKYKYKGKLLACSDLADLAGVSQTTMRVRLERLGWSVTRAVETPLRGAGPGQRHLGSAGQRRPGGALQLGQPATPLAAWWLRRLVPLV